MAAQYPGSTKTFAPKVDGGVQIIMANDINEITDEVTAVEADLRAGLPVARGGTGGTTKAQAQANLDIPTQANIDFAIANAKYDASAIISGIFNALRIPALNLISGVLNRVQQAVGTAYADVNNAWSVAQTFWSAVVVAHADTPIIYLVRGGVYEGELLLSGGNMYFDNNGVLTFRNMAGTFKMSLSAAGALLVQQNLTANGDIFGASLNTGGGLYVGGGANIVGALVSGNLNSGSIRTSDAYYEKSRPSPVGYWEPYTPTFTTLVIGNGSISGWFTRIGNTVHFKVLIVCGNATTIGGSAFTCSTPTGYQVPAAAASTFHGVGLDSSTGAFADFAGQASTGTTFYVRMVTGSYTGYLTQTTPWTWASGDQIFLYGTYETY